VRFTLLLASSALAASLALSACSSGGSQAVPSGSQVTAPMGHHVGPYAVMTGARQAQSCPSPYYYCYEIAPGSTLTEEWCIITTGSSCSSNLAPGTWEWKDLGKVSKVGGGKGKGIKSKWSPKKGNPTDNVVTVKANVPSTGSSPGYYFNWESCAKSGPYKGSCVGPVDIGIIVS
jgi:hypothetical protein